MWFYRAIDEYGLPVAESYKRADLIDKLTDEFGAERLKEFKIVRVFDKTLK
jgi:hypothetical protein